MTSPLIPCISQVFYVAMVIPYYFQLPISDVKFGHKDRETNDAKYLDLIELISYLLQGNFDKDIGRCFK